MKKLLIVNALVILTLLLSACGTPVAEITRYVDVAIGCSDPRCGFHMALGGKIPDDWLIIHRVAGASSMNTDDYLTLSRSIETQGLKLRRIYLINHFDQSCAGLTCGGLNAADILKKGGDVHPPELASWAEKNVIPENAFYGLSREADIARRALPSAEINTLLFDHKIQKFIPVWSSAERNTHWFLTSGEWDLFTSDRVKFPLRVTPANQIQSEGLRRLLQLNQSAQPAAMAEAARLGYGTGANFQKLIITSQMSGDILKYRQAFVITRLPGEPMFNVTAPLSYAITHGEVAGIKAIQLELITTSAELPGVIEGLNASPTFQNLVDNRSWTGGITWSSEATNARAIWLRPPGEAMRKLLFPISGGSGLPEVRTTRLQIIKWKVPDIVNEASIGESLMSATGTQAERSLLARLAVKFAPYAGATLRVLRVVGVGLQLLGAFLIVNDAGNALFRFGPDIAVNQTITHAAFDEELLNTLAMRGNVLNSPAARIFTNAGAITLDQVWDEAQTQMKLGEEACGSITFNDPEMELPVFWCATAGTDSTRTYFTPGTITFYNAATDSVVETVVLHYTTTATNDRPYWSVVSNNDTLSVHLDTSQFPDIKSCVMVVSFYPADHLEVHFDPHCEGEATK